MGVQQHEEASARARRVKLLEEILAGKTHYDHLERLDVSCRRMAGQIERFLQMLECRPELALRELDLGWNDLGRKGAARLARSPIVGQLHCLHLSGNELGADGVAALCAGRSFAALTSLQLSYNELDDAAARTLARATCFPALRELNLRRNWIGDAGIEALGASSLPSRLTRLNVEYNEFGDAGFRALDRDFDERKTEIW